MRRYLNVKVCTERNQSFCADICLLTKRKKLFAKLIATRRMHSQSSRRQKQCPWTAGPPSEEQLELMAAASSFWSQASQSGGAVGAFLAQRQQKQRIGQRVLAPRSMQNLRSCLMPQWYELNRSSIAPGSAVRHIPRTQSL